MDPDAHEAALDGVRPDLTGREFDPLRYLALRSGQVISGWGLLTHVWHLPYGGADKTV